MGVLGVGSSYPFRTTSGQGLENPSSRRSSSPRPSPTQTWPDHLGSDRTDPSRCLSGHPRRPCLPGGSLLGHRATLLSQALAHGVGDRWRRRGVGLAPQAHTDNGSPRRSRCPHRYGLRHCQPCCYRRQHGSRRSNHVDQLGNAPDRPRCPGLLVRFAAHGGICSDDGNVRRVHPLRGGGPEIGIWSGGDRNG